MLSQCTPPCVRWNVARYRNDSIPAEPATTTAPKPASTRPGRAGAAHTRLRVGGIEGNACASSVRLQQLAETNGSAMADVPAAVQQMQQQLVCHALERPATGGDALRLALIICSCNFTLCLHSWHTRTGLPRQTPCCHCIDDPAHSNSVSQHIPRLTRVASTAGRLRRHRHGRQFRTISLTCSAAFVLRWRV